MDQRRRVMRREEETPVGGVFELRQQGLGNRHRKRQVVGLRARDTLENGLARVGGLLAAHAVLEAQVTGEDERVRVEAYVLKDDRCVYDLVYVAPTSVFAERRPDFQRFVESFVRE